MFDSHIKSVAKVSSHMANRLTVLSERIHAKFGYERKIIIGPHKLYVRYKPKGHTGKYSGKSNYYVNGELYLKDHANPVHVDYQDAIEGDELDLIASPKYRNAIRQKIITDALNTPENGYDFQEKLLMALVGIAAIGFLVIVIVMMG